MEKKRLSPNRFFYKKRLMVLFFGIIGFVLPMLYGLINGFPIPFVHDEFSYLLAADTFANGRVTNPTPQFEEHFESPHILLEPSYTSKYPPMQSLFLAIGQVLFGYPIFGVWLSCGLMASALFWMLTVWTRPKWAFLGALLMVLFIGINSYWAQSYWGGMVAATGGALFFGGFRKLSKKLSFGNTFLMILGGVILVNSRAFEGTVMMLPALFVLLAHLLRKKTVSISHKISQFILPGIFLTTVALSAMAYYNYNVTGSPLKFAYTVHQAQYHPTALFIFQSPYESATKGHPRLRKLYEHLSTSDPIRKLDEYGLPNSVYLTPLYGYCYLLVNTPLFLISLPLTIFLYGVVLFPVSRNKWLAFIGGTILFTFACMSLVTFWDNVHYAAPLTCCFYLLLIESFRYIFVTTSRKIPGQMISTSLIIIVLISLLYNLLTGASVFTVLQITSNEVYSSDNQLLLDKPVKLVIPKKATYIKGEIEKSVENSPDSYLALVSYDHKYSFHDEIVYNKANIENCKIIWAHDLGEEKNKALLNYYSNRKILYIKLTGTQFEITTLPQK